MGYMDVFHKAVTQTLRSNFDRPTGDPKGEGAARIIPLGSTKQVKKPCPWGRLFYCLLVSEMELWLLVHKELSDAERPLGRPQRGEALAPNNPASKIGRKLHKAVTQTFNQYLDLIRRDKGS
jgi:hypothetical protein